MNRTERIALLVAAAIVCCQMLLPPVIGLANNGDFGKLILRYNLYSPMEDEYAYAPTKYTFEPQRHWVSGYVSSESLLVPPALGLNRIFSKDGRFDIRMIGVLHALLFLLALRLAMPLLRGRVVFLALAILMFTDVLYVSYFNSFYMDTIAYLGLLLSLVLYARLVWKQGDPRWNYFGALLCAVLFLTSKMQHVPAGAALLLFLCWKGPKPWRVPALAIAVAGIAIGFTGRSTLTETDRATHPFNLIFSGILPMSKDVSGDLRELGLDDSFRPYIGTHTYTPGGPLLREDFARDFGRRATLLRVGWFYLRHPRVPLALSRAALLQGSLQRVDTLGNFDRGAGLPPIAMSHAFALWSDLQYALFARKPVPYFLYFVALALLVIGLTLRRRAPAPLSMAVLLVTCVELLVACLADAAEVGRHFFVFHGLTDLMLLGILSAGLRRNRAAATSIAPLLAFPAR